MKHKVLVTGSCGFIFTNFLRLAVTTEKDYNWVSIDNLSTKHSINNIYANRSHKFYLGDVADAHFIDKVFEVEKPNIVIHGAASSHVDDSINSAHDFIHNNVLGTQVMLDASIKHGVQKFVYISTDEVYGHLEDDNALPWTEDQPLNPRNPYSSTKAAGELLVKAAHQTHGLTYNITRSCNNLGPKQSTKNLVPKVIKCILNKELIPIYGQGLQRREWIHVADNCSAILQIMKEGKNNEVYNISAGYEVSNLEMVHEICNIMNQGHDLISFVQDRKGHDFRYALDNSKLKRLEWKPNFKFKSSIDHCINWYINNKWFLNLSI